MVAPGAGVNGQLLENLLLSFWTDPLRRVYEDTAVGIGSGATSTGNRVGAKAAPLRGGKRTSVVSKRDKAKAMHAGGHSYREIGRTLGVSASYAHKLVNG